MRERLGAGGDAGRDFFRRGGQLVSQRNGHAPLRESFHESGHSLDLCRDGNQLYRAVRSLLIAFEKREVGRTHPLDRMRPNRSRRRGDERAFEMDAENPVATLRVVPSCGGNRPDIGKHHGGVTRDEGRQVMRRAVIGQPLGDGADLFDGQPGGVEVDAAVSVDLQIHPFRFHVTPPVCP